MTRALDPMPWAMILDESFVPHCLRTSVTQGAMRRLLLLPMRRWHAAASQANAEDPQNLLMAGLSPAPGKEGLHRLRSGAAVRRNGTPPLRTLGKDARKSWKKLSSFFG